MSRGLCICVLGTTMSCSKMAKLIVMLFGCRLEWVQRTMH